MERSKPSQNDRGRHRPRYYYLLPVWDSFTELTQNRCRNFWPVFTPPHLVSNQLSFPVFYLASPQTALLLYISILTWASTTIMKWVLGTYRSLSYSFLPDHCVSLSHRLESPPLLCPSILLSSSWPVSLTRKQLPTKNLITQESNKTLR